MIRWDVHWVDSSGQPQQALVSGGDDPVAALRAVRVSQDVDYFVVERMKWADLEKKLGAHRDQIAGWAARVPRFEIQIYFVVDEGRCNMSSVGDLCEAVSRFPEKGMPRSRMRSLLAAMWNNGSPRPIPSRAVDEEALDHLLS